MILTVFVYIQHNVKTIYQQYIFYAPYAYFCLFIKHLSFENVNTAYFSSSYEDDIEWQTFLWKCFMFICFDMSYNLGIQLCHSIIIIIHACKSTDKSLLTTCCTVQGILTMQSKTIAVVQSKQSKTIAIVWSMQPCKRPFSQW